VQKNQLNDKMIGKIIGGYTIEEKLGRGGNADVYCATDKNGDKVALKLLKVNKSKYFHEKYNRFKSEIKIVMQNQDNIKGIIPILRFELSDEPTEKNRPWYVMPLATPLYDIIDSKKSIEEIVHCIKEFAEILVQLHDKGIVHRDIKPSNLYRYKDSWAFGDFGLVDYPEKDDLTRKGEAVGPKATIGPEMRRNAKDADGKLADIYSLAKTMWILLTGVNDGFEGQYSHKSKSIGLSNYQQRKKDFLAPLHKLIEESTSNIPQERPTARQFLKILNDWVTLNNNFEKRNLMEWEFVIKEIIPHTLPETIAWTKTEDIVYILNLLGSVNSLNHVFMPSGGGMDLLGCNPSNENGYIELLFGIYTLKLKPKRLILETFDASFDWNYFLLETEEIPLTGVYNYHDSSSICYEVVLELEPGKYIEDYHINYGVYNGHPLPDSARVIELGIKGTYAIFSKGSTYNDIPSTYEGYQNKMSSTDFRRFIEAMIAEIKFAEENPEIVQEQRKKRQEIEEKEKELRRKIFEQKRAKLKEKWEERIKNIDLPMVGKALSLEEKTLCSVAYSVNFYEQIFYGGYYISKENKLIKYASTQFELMINDREICTSDLLLFCDFTEAYSYAKELEAILLDFEDSKDIGNRLIMDIKILRLKKPVHLFTKKELEILLKNADDSISNQLVIEVNGNLNLINPTQIDYLEMKKFPVIGDGFSPFQNSVGKHSKLLRLDEIYLSLLESWDDHLRLNKRVSVSDYIDPALNEEKLISSIKEACEKYDNDNDNVRR
jgi:serine/threonine protein kinase